MVARTHSGSLHSIAAASLSILFSINAAMFSFLDAVLSTSVLHRLQKFISGNLQKRKKKHLIRVGLEVFVVLSAVDALTAVSRSLIIPSVVSILPLHENVCLHGFFFVAQAVDNIKIDEAAAGAAAPGAHLDKEQASAPGSASSSEVAALHDVEASAGSAEKDGSGLTDKPKVGRHTGRSAGGRAQRHDNGLTDKFKYSSLVRSTSRMGRHPIKESCRAIQRWSSLESNVGNFTYGRRSDSRTKSIHCPKEPLVNLARDTSDSLETQHFFHLVRSNKVRARIFTPQSAVSDAVTTDCVIGEDQKVADSVEDVLGLRKTSRDSTKRHHDMPCSTSLIRSRSSWNLPRRSRNSLTLSPSVLRDLTGSETRNRLVASKGAKEEDSDSSSSSAEGVFAFDEIDHPKALPPSPPQSHVLPGSGSSHVNDLEKSTAAEQCDEMDGAPLFNMRTPRGEFATGLAGTQRAGPLSKIHRDSPETIIKKFTVKIRSLLQKYVPKVREYRFRTVQTPLKLESPQCSAQHIKELKALVASKTSLLHSPAIRVLLEFCKGMLWQSAQLVVTLVAPKSELKSIEDLFSKLGIMVVLFEKSVDVLAPTWPSSTTGEKAAARETQKNAVSTLQSVAWMMNAALLILHGHMVVEFYQREEFEDFQDDLADVADRTSNVALICAQAVLEVGEVCRSAFEMLDPEAQASVCDPANAGVQDAFYTENVEFVRRETLRFAKRLEELQKTLKKLAETTLEMYEAIADSSNNIASVDVPFYE